MNLPWGTYVWQQFGAAINMLENAMRACPEQLWTESVWADPTDAPEYTQFWFIVFHALKWLDLYLSGTREGFEVPAPFIAWSLPEKPYTKHQLQAYFVHCREKCRLTLEALTDEKASHVCTLPSGDEVSFVEMQLYSMRHVQEHAAQLSLFLGSKAGSAPDWVSKADSKEG